MCGNQGISGITAFEVSRYTKILDMEEETSRYDKPANLKRFCSRSVMICWLIAIVHEKVNAISQHSKHFITLYILCEEFRRDRGQVSELYIYFVKSLGVTEDRFQSLDNSLLCLSVLLIRPSCLVK